MLNDVSASRNQKNTLSESQWQEDAVTNKHVHGGRYHRQGERKLQDIGRRNKGGQRSYRKGEPEAGNSGADVDDIPSIVVKEPKGHDEKNDDDPGSSMKDGGSTAARVLA